MMIPWPFQNDAIAAGVSFFQEKLKYNGIEILPTGSGKSVVIANIAKQLPGKTVIFQPSKEILEQNFSKYISYGYRAGIYSASAGMKYIDDVTFATIGSVVKKPHIFQQFKNIIVDECHLVNPREGMYHKFINDIHGAKVLGLTATPYRLVSDLQGGELRFLTRQTPRMFNRVLYYVQNSVLFNDGYLATLEYYNFNVIDRSMLKLNDKGTDFTDQSLRNYYRRINMPAITIDYANRLLVKRKNVLVFCSLIEEAETVAMGIPGAVVITSETPPHLRAQWLGQYRAGMIRCVVNVGVLTTGFDFPELECVLIARSTLSLGLYYQMVGRLMRRHPEKQSGWIVDLGGNINKFGRLESLKIIQDKKGLYAVWNKFGPTWRQLTNVPFTIY